MASQAITQEQLFLPLLQFIADHGGKIHRKHDDVMTALADRLGITTEERDRSTDGGRNQWMSTVENCRRKLAARGMILGGESSVWPLSDKGWEYVAEPPDEWIARFDDWREQRGASLAGQGGSSPEKPSGHFEERMEQFDESLGARSDAALRPLRNRALVEALKEEYGYGCQLCDSSDPECPKISTGQGRYYVEVHHLKGLAEVGKRAILGQLDEDEYENLTSYHNVVVVCPYHHRLLHHRVPSFEFHPERLSFVDEDGEEMHLEKRKGRHLKGYERNPRVRKESPGGT